MVIVVVVVKVLASLAYDGIVFVLFWCFSKEDVKIHEWNTLKYTVTKAREFWLRYVLSSMLFAATMAPVFGWRWQWVRTCAASTRCGTRVELWCRL